jgi:CxxC motif-containing protein (DUF1111 family)
MLSRATHWCLTRMTVVMLCASVFLAGEAAAQNQNGQGQNGQGSGGSGAAGPVDPGPRVGSPAAGGPLPGLSMAELNLFKAALARFQEVDSVSGGIAGETGVGLGPRFNANSCAACHAQPTIGGSSPAVNPEVAMATLDGAQNTVPSFITLNGPVREARFVNITAPAGGSSDDQQDTHGNAQQATENQLDGGVHDLYTITGRSDAQGCNIAQPDFATELAANNVIFRIPTPLFGAGLVEDTPDNVLIANAQPGAQFNHSANDGTITKFGWKAQNKSLQIFAGEAYNVEQGVTNFNFPNERDTTAGCQFNATPEDGFNLAGITPPSGSPASDYAPDVENFAEFMRDSAPPTPAPATSSTTNGQQAFMSVGCASCHVAQQTTHAGIQYSPFSDFALHTMGDGLADGIIQGNAAGNQFRTAPLWGIGQRLFFLHDGRTSDLLAAIQAHVSNGSEANGVIGNFNALPVATQQDILNFLRSL